jgi:hypothetical protein
LEGVLESLERQQSPGSRESKLDREAQVQGREKTSKKANLLVDADDLVHSEGIDEDLLRGRRSGGRTRCPQDLDILQQAKGSSQAQLSDRAAKDT